ncbi:hypothetical protein CYY_005641 [Polysphondylium violaceum]|uniref:Uncharacterized protein n=1 Tax=Polysphondylium violaceum TaxID=133409 RepID=A0A8J4PSM0_9MYCE|nr:hypothetical protein CYY_005641 [Polysphondylium violaceum]
MGASSSRLLDLRFDPSSVLFNQNSFENALIVLNKLYWEEHKKEGKFPLQLQAAGARTLVAKIKDIVTVSIGAPKTVVFEVQDDSIGYLFVNINAIWVFMYRVVGKSHPYNGLPIRVNTNLQFLFLVNSKVVRWSYRAYDFPKTLIIIDKEIPRGAMAQVYTQSILGVEHFKYKDNDLIQSDGKFAITPISIEGDRKYIYDWTTNNDLVEK